MDTWTANNMPAQIHMGLPSPAYYDAHNRLVPLPQVCNHQAAANFGQQMPGFNQPTSAFETTARAIAERLPMLDDGSHGKTAFSQAAHAKYCEMLARMFSDGATNANSHGALFLEGLQLAMTNRAHHAGAKGLGLASLGLPLPALPRQEQQLKSPPRSIHADSSRAETNILTPPGSSSSSSSSELDSGIRPSLLKHTSTALTRSLSAPQLRRPTMEVTPTLTVGTVLAPSAKAAANRLKIALAKVSAADDRGHMKARMKLVHDPKGRANLRGSRLPSSVKHVPFSERRPDLMSNVLGWTATTSHRKHPRGQSTPQGSDADEDSDTDSVCSDPGCDCDSTSCGKPLTCRLGPDNELTQASQTGCKSLLNLVRTRRRRLATKAAKTQAQAQAQQQQAEGQAQAQVMKPKSCIRDRTISHRTKRVRISNSNECSTNESGIQMPPSPESDDQWQPLQSANDPIETDLDVEPQPLPEAETEVVIYQNENIPAKADSGQARRPSAVQGLGLLQRRARMPSSVFINVNEVVSAKTPLAHLTIPLERSRSWDTQTVWAPPMFGFENEPIHSPLDEDFPDTVDFSYNPFGSSSTSASSSSKTTLVPKTPARSTPLRVSHTRTPSDRIMTGMFNSHGHSFSLESLSSDHGTMSGMSEPSTPSDRLADKVAVYRQENMPSWLDGPGPRSPTLGVKSVDADRGQRNGLAATVRGSVLAFR